jgi:hypothetical protein
MSLRYADNLEEQIGDVARDMLLLEYIAFTVEQKGTSVLAISDVKKSIDMLKDSSSSLNYQSLFKVLDSITRQEDLGISIDFMIVALAKHISNLEVKDEFKTMPAKRMVGNVPVVSFIDSNWMSMSNLYLYELIEEPKVLLALPTHGDVFELDEQFEVILQQP